MERGGNGHERLENDRWNGYELFYKGLNEVMAFTLNR